MEDLQHALQRAAFAGDDRAPEEAVAERRLLGPAVVEVRGVEKTFRIPRHRVDTLKERASRPFSRAEYRHLRALRDVSFDVRRGEFFGIVGRNGSGKSTLLKIMASIYRADAGTIRMAGRLAPFIELGVGFNPELTARENVALNGVMMGLGRREAARRLDAVLDFAELGEFVDLKLKNYSSGMMVRLAFAVMVEADADIMLIDEVLAVGDASFAQKCVEVFKQKRAAGKTIVLVTHDMATVQAFCDSAMLLHDGQQRYIGDPQEAVLRYYRLNFSGSDRDAPADVDVRLVDAWLADSAGDRVEQLEPGEPIGLNLVVEARRELTGLLFNFRILNVDGFPVFGFGRALDEPDRIAAGQRLRITVQSDNPLLPSRYSVDCAIARNRNPGDLAASIPLLDFIVRGANPVPGMISVRTKVDAVLER